MVGEASGIHMSGPDIQQLFAQAVGVGDDVGVAVGFDDCSSWCWVVL